MKAFKAGIDKVALQLVLYDLSYSYQIKPEEL